MQLKSKFGKYFYQMHEQINKLNKTDSDGNTPLHLAIINENQKIAKILIKQTTTVYW